MYTILLVEDSATDRRLIEGMLERRMHFEIETAEDGLAALKKMQAKTPDLVVTDMQMPNMNGLQLVDKIRAYYPLVPVILITSDGSEDLAARALQRGAAGYVPKSRCDELLNDTVDHVISMTRSESSFERIIDCATLSHFEFVFPNDFSLIAPLIELAQRMCVGMGVCDEPGAVQVGVALEHAISNAIYHGNLEIGSTSASADQTLMKQRLTFLPYKDRRVHVEIGINRNEARFLVRDDGPGFNVREVATNGRKTALTGESGRGLFLMWAFMDNITFDQKGSSVVMVKRKSVEAAQPSLNQQSKTLPKVLGKLIPRDGSETLELTKTRSTVGRDSSCELVIRSSAVSQHHCLLYLYQGWWYIRDLKSKNGIRVNNVSFNEHLVRPGAHVSIGKHEFIIDYEPFDLGAEGMDPPANPF